MQYQAELDVAVRAAREAGALLAETMRRPRVVLKEEGRDIKLQADRDAEARILHVLSGAPHPVLTEESGTHGAYGADVEAWVVDPLDGTLNFQRGAPICAVSIALARGSEPLLGVIYDFNRDECFTGIVGVGAWLNNAPMHVSGIRERSRAILTTGFPTNRSYSEESLLEFVRHVQQFKKLRLLGSAALMLAYVACGRYEAYAEDDIMFWDVAAGAALVRAAGGHVDLRPSPQLQWGCRIRAAAHEGLWES